jgi:adenylate kinase family enzyme
MRKFAGLLILIFIVAGFVAGCSENKSATYNYLSQYGEVKIDQISESNVDIRLVVNDLYLQGFSPPDVCVDVFVQLHQDFPKANNFKCEIYQDPQNHVIAYYDAKDQYLSFNFKYFGGYSRDTYKATWKDLEKVSKNEILLGDLPQ